MNRVRKPRKGPAPCVHRKIADIEIETRMIERYQSHGDKYPKLIRMSLPRLSFLNAAPTPDPIV